MSDRSQHPTNHQPLEATHRSWSGKSGVLVLLGGLGLMFALVSLLVFTAPLARNDLGLLGGLRVEAGDDVVVYVGDRRVGVGNVDVTWNELLGAAGRPPLVVPVADAGSQSALAAALAGTEATVVWQEEGPAGTHRGEQDVNFQFRQVVLRRGGGELDHLFLVECEFVTSETEWQHVLIPVRTRKPDDVAAGYFPTARSQGGGNVNRGMIPSRRDRATFELKLSVGEGAPPAELSDQPETAALWTPPAE